MKIPGEEATNFITINEAADSLHSLIADMWKTLFGSQGSLQYNCNREGFNAKSDDLDTAKARTGIIGNNENHCYICDSRIGFETGGRHDDSNTCGIEAVAAPDNGDRHIKAMGYILIR